MNIKCIISLAILAITVLYTMVYSGITGVLLTASVGLIIAAFVEPFELVAAATVLFAVLYTLFLKRWMYRMEGFQGEQEIIQRIASMEQGQVQKPQRLKNPRNEPAGVYDPSVEGFEDIQPSVPKEGASSEGSSAPTELSSLHQVDPKQMAEVT
jgi:membrane protein implicated in regulation of membrane protease activity